MIVWLAKVFYTFFKFLYQQYALKFRNRLRNRLL